MHSIDDYQLLMLSCSAVALGLFVLIKGGSWTVGSAVAIAERRGLSKLFIGATIIAFGTSIPELFASVNANLKGFPGLSLGNVIGSNVANILLIVGTAAVIFAIKISPRMLIRDTSVVMVATLVLVSLMLSGVIERWHGLLMFATLVGYVVFQYRSDGYHSGSLDDSGIHGQHLEEGKAAGLLVLGLVALALGSEILVQGAVVLGKAIGVPEAVIGLTVVAFGTSLPELATSISAALQRHSEVIIGNILGSNLFNILSIVAITAMVKPLVVPESVTGAATWFMLAITAVFCAWMLWSGKVGRILGGVMVMAYLLFVGWQYVGLQL